MSIIRSEPDPRDYDENAMDEDIKNAKAELNNSVGDIREVMQSVIEDMTDEVVMLSRVDKDTFCETISALMEIEINSRAEALAEFRRG